MTTPSRVGAGSGERALWSAVVMQAIDDIRTAKFDSLDYSQSVYFMTGDTEARTHVADYLGLHADDLKQSGDREVRKRRIAEGLPPVELRVVKPRVAKPKYTPPVDRRIPVRVKFNPFAVGLSA